MIQRARMLHFDLLDLDKFRLLLQQVLLSSLPSVSAPISAYLVK